jgi:3-oxoacyl-[acyl-carrier protein] reductase
MDGKIAIVTGAGRMRSIGRPIAVELARAGCDVVITGTGRSPDRFPPGRQVRPVVCDVADSGAVDLLVQQTLDEFGRVDFLINNAGAARGEDRVPVIDLGDEVWDRVMQINLYGTFYLSRAVARSLVKAGQGGSIVNISSIAAKLGSPNTAAYGASKAAIGALTASMARELGSAGIRVNAICPGIIDTSRMDDVPRGEPWEHMISGIPLGRAGTGDDIAWATTFLCSDQGAWVTGQQWNVDGGHVTER